MSARAAGVAPEDVRAPWLGSGWHKTTPPLWLTASTRLPGLMPFLGKFPEFLVKAWQKQALMVAELVIREGKWTWVIQSLLLLELKTEVALITVTKWSTLDCCFQQFPTNWRYKHPCLAVCFLLWAKSYTSSSDDQYSLNLLPVDVKSKIWALAPEILQTWTHTCEQDCSSQWTESRLHGFPFKPWFSFN